MRWVWALPMTVVLMAAFLIVSGHRERSVSASEPPALPVAAWADKCVACHTKITPQLVSDWQASKHRQKGIARAVCHGDQHTTDQDIAKAKIPIPETCAMCHDT